LLVKLSPYLIAMLIGLMVGVERERRMLKGQLAMGVRSFLLLALVGAIAGGINQPLVALGLVLFACVITLVGYIRISRLTKDIKSVGLTTEIAAMATFGLGYFANFEPLLSLALGVIMVLVLLNKSIMHTFVKRHLKPDEVQAAAVLLLLAVGVIPLIPDQAIDPWNIFYPRRLAIIIALIAGIQFTGYAFSRIFGQKIGTPISGLLAGIISSTAAFIAFSRLAKAKSGYYLPIVAAANFAVVASIGQLIVLLAAISLPLVIAILIPLISIALVPAVIAVLLSSKNHKDNRKSLYKNPLSLLSAIKLGMILTAFIFIVEFAERFIGLTFTKLVTFLGALFELQGIAVACANMFENKTISLNVAASTVLIAVIASLVSKTVITAIFADGVYRKVMVSIMIGLLALSLGFWLLIRFFPAMLIKI
jgi:uncharacterized membrane protein (DUF4010 family)